MKHHKLGDIARSHPAAPALLRSYGLDYCCGGARSLEAACREAGLELQDVLRDLQDLQDLHDLRDRPAHRRQPATSPDTTTPAPDTRSVADIDWATLSVDDIVTFIQQRFHAGLLEGLDDLIRAARTVEHVHATNPEAPRGLARHLRTLRADLADHLAKEEKILFPLINRRETTGLWEPTEALRLDHEDAGTALRQTRRLTNDLTAPPGACPTWTSLYESLVQFEADLMDHAGLENDVLFPRALDR